MIATGDPDFGDRIVLAAGKGITRRTMLRRSLQAAVGAGVVMSSPFALFERRANAASCSAFGTVTTWGTVCASTAACTGCVSGNCGSNRVRCSYWGTAEPTGNYCWCSQGACWGGFEYGYYTCCDCWTGGSGGCGSGTGACVCKTFVQTSSC